MAVEWAANLALAAGAELHIAHIHPPALLSRGVRGATHLAQLATRATAHLGEQGRAAAHMHLREGASAQELLALRCAASLLMVRARQTQRAGRPSREGRPALCERPRRATRSA